MNNLVSQLHIIFNTETLTMNQGLPIALIAVTVLLVLCWLPNIFERKKA